MRQHIKQHMAAGRSMSSIMLVLEWHESVQIKLQDEAQIGSGRMNDVKPGFCQAGSLPKQEAHL